MQPQELEFAGKRRCRTPLFSADLCRGLVSSVGIPRAFDMATRPQVTAGFRHFSNVSLLKRSAQSGGLQWFLQTSSWKLYLLLSHAKGIILQQSRILNGFICSNKGANNFYLVFVQPVEWSDKSLVFLQLRIGPYLNHRGRPKLSCTGQT
jgi:hypothetical protein